MRGSCGSDPATGNESRVKNGTISFVAPEPGGWAFDLKITNGFPMIKLSGRTCPQVATIVCGWQGPPAATPLGCSPQQSGRSHT
jgi:hypothetical protein